jgi:hypothetical protein
LVLGIAGWILFHIHQASPLCREPSIPPRVLSNRTSAAGYFVTLTDSMTLESTGFFMPVYFQAVLGSSPIQSGIKLLPTTIAMVPFGIMAGILMSKTGLYRPLHWIAMALCAIGADLISRLDANSNKAEWICFQIIIAAATLPAILAALPESDVATASGAFSFIRSFGYVWGVTLPSIIFNNQFDKHIGQINDSAVQSQLQNGAAYGQVSGGFVKSLPMEIKREVIGVYVDALRVVWEVILAFACFEFFVVFAEKHIELRKDLDTEFGLKDNEKNEQGTLEVGESGPSSPEKSTIKEGRI